MRIIVSGLIAQYPLGGVAWDYLQYPVGLSLLGHEVLYLEDTGQWPYNPLERGVSKGCDFNVAFLHETMARFQLEDNWAYRFPWESEWFGMSDSKRAEFIRSADLLINVSGSLLRPQDYRMAGRLAYIDSDPVFTQLKLAKGQSDFRAIVDSHDVHFSFGETIHNSPLPESGHQWLPTRQPILLDQWTHHSECRPAFTTIMNWTSYKAIEYDGVSYGQKDMEFRRFIDLPSSLPSVQLELAVSHGKTSRTPRELLAHHGWRLVDPTDACPDVESYRSYIQSSMAEWSVAKNAYVVGKPGWFSCRSACYLASGRPVVVQDTGFTSILPCGEGIIPFSSPDEAVEGIKDVISRYHAHSKTAREIAAAYFDFSTVLTRLIQDASA